MPRYCHEHDWWEVNQLDNTFWQLPHEIVDLIQLGRKALRKYLNETENRLTLTIEGEPMSDYQLNQGDQVVVTITDTDEVTGLAVTPDAGSVSAALSPNASSSTVVVDPSGTFATLTAGTNESVGDLLTVTASVNGVASTPASGSFDVVAAVTPPPDATTLSLSFGTEAADPTPAEDVPSNVGTGAGQINPVTGQVNP